MRFSMLLVGLSAVVAVACGGSDEGSDGGGAGKAGSGTAGAGSGSSGSGSGTGGSGSGSVDSGAPEGTPANELTDAQVTALCESMGKAAQTALGADAQEATCGFTAYFVASLTPEGDAAAACQTAYDECLREPTDTTQEECTKPSESCTATVGEIEACLNDSLAQVKKLLSGLPGCEDVGKDVGTPSLGGTSPPSCQVVQEKCPEVLDNVPDSAETLPG